MSDLFLSYAKEDKQLAKKLCADLSKRGLNVWFDETSLVGGQDWEREITRAIKASKFFIALLSSHSVSKRGVVQKELKQAIQVMEELPENEVYIIPVRLEECNPSYDILKKIHWIDLFDDWQEGLRQIQRATRTTTVDKKEFDVPVQTVDICKLLREAISLLEPMAIYRKIEWNIKKKVKIAKIKGNPERVRQALENILMNSIKHSYTIEGESLSWVNISVYLRGQDVLVSVEHWGTPIDAEEIDKGLIFQPFYIGKYSKDPQSTGLGLAVTKRIVEQHGGRIMVSSLPARSKNLNSDYNQPFVTNVTIALPALEEWL